VCPVDVSKSTKLQDAQWIGQVLSAARTGDAATMKVLLAQDRAKARLRKLHKPVEVWSYYPGAFCLVHPCMTQPRRGGFDTL
jgi:hypothetical protein